MLKIHPIVNLMNMNFQRAGWLQLTIKILGILNAGQNIIKSTPTMNEVNLRT